MPYVRILGKGFRIPDLDRVFCYDTPKMLKVIDFKPGLVYRCGIAFVFFYIVTVVREPQLESLRTKQCL